nr:hypothetical protein [Paenibacillus phyllosphaerae]
MNKDELIALLEMTLERENELLRTYVIASERIHNNAALKLRLINFAEGNAKRTKQLIDEISILKS